MATVPSVLDLRRERLARQLAAELRDVGSAWADVAEVEVVGEWRAAARRAGRLLGWHVRTGSSGDRVWAVSGDYPVSEADKAEAGEWASMLLLGPGGGESPGRPE